MAQLREYLAGERRVFDLPLDWSLTRGAQRRVLETLFATVGYGETVTYGELADRSRAGQRVHRRARGGRDHGAATRCRSSCRAIG